MVTFFYSPYCPGDKLFVQFREQLVELHPETVELAICMWLKLEVDPEIAYMLLPTRSRRMFTTRLTKEERRIIIRYDLKVWISYVDRFNAKANEKYTDESLVESGS